MRPLILAAALVLATGAPALAQPNTFNGGSTDYRPNSSMGTSQDVAVSVDYDLNCS